MLKLETEPLHTCLVAGGGTHTWCVTSDGESKGEEAQGRLALQGGHRTGCWRGQRPQVGRVPLSRH